MMFSSFPPMIGTRTWTVARKFSRAPPVSMRRQHRGALQVHRRVQIAPDDRGRRDAVRDRPPGLLAPDAQVAPVELRDHPRQLVAVHHLHGDDLDGAVVAGFATDPHRLQRGEVNPGFGQPCPPVRLVRNAR